ncbi:hypothetical protein [Deinococcus koreensis]|uniref:hypothetical protein n=1 Tax=Deinococcus koreensis TaxID=2054903 RepID=UPI0010574212|nr:hypothetical protein [Deinococcus koreensis]
MLDAPTDSEPRPFLSIPQDLGIDVTPNAFFQAGETRKYIRLPGFEGVRQMAVDSLNVWIIRLNFTYLRDSHNTYRLDVFYDPRSDKITKHTCYRFPPSDFN